MLERIPDLQQPAQLLRLLPDEDVALERAGQHARVLGPPDEAREEAFGRVLAREARADGAAAVVEHDWRVVQRVGHGGF